MLKQNKVGFIRRPSGSWSYDGICLANTWWKIGFTGEIVMISFTQQGHSIVSENQRTILRSKWNRIRDKLATRFSSQHGKLAPPQSTGHSASQVQVAEGVPVKAAWSGPAFTSSDTVGRNQSLARLDPPASPQSLRNCGARSDKPLIC